MANQSRGDELKQAVVIRTDLGLSAGKAAAQAAHASLWAASRASEAVRTEWEAQLATKIVLGVKTESELRDLAEQARESGLPVSIVDDAGRTEVDSGTTTAVGLGPGSIDAVNEITGNLSLYQ